MLRSIVLVNMKRLYVYFFGTLGTYDNKNIANILKISLNEYEKRLSKIFKTSRNEKGVLYIENNKEQEVLEKFKEEFSNELTLLKLKDSI